MMLMMMFILLNKCKSFAKITYCSSNCINLWRSKAATVYV